MHAAPMQPNTFTKRATKTRGNIMLLLVLFGGGVEARLWTASG